LKILKEVSKKELKEFIYTINLEDKNLYNELNKDNTIGIFQLNGGTASDIVKQIKPQSFKDINAVNSLSRPGTSMFVQDYINGRDKNKKKYSQQISDLLSDSYGIILFQEQVMSIFNKIGNFSLEETNEIRGLMKRLGKADKDPKDIKKWDKAVKRFIKNSTEKGIKEKDAKYIADDLLRLSSYSFNLSHSSAYSYTAIMTLYFSYYFKKYFLASELEYEIENDKNLIEAFSSIRSQGIEILPPDINNSFDVVYPLEGNQLILGLSNIKQVSINAAKHIIENRPYKSLFDFITKIEGKYVKINAIKALVASGAFDFESKNRKRVIKVLETFWEKKKSIKVIEKLKLIWEEADKEVLSGIKTDAIDLKNYEKNYLGGNFFTSSFSEELKHALLKINRIYHNFKEVNRVAKKTPVEVEEIRKIIDRNGNEMAFLSIEDMNGCKTSIPVFASYWKVIKDLIEEDKKFLLSLFLDDNGNILFGKRGWVDNIKTIERMVKGLK
jgi:DNA polymerase III subunit alpha